MGGQSHATITTLKLDTGQYSLKRMLLKISQSFTITEMAPTRAFSWLKASTSKGLLRDCENQWIVCSSNFGPLPQVLASVPEKDAGLLAPLKELGCSTTHNNMDTVTHRHGVKL